MNKGLAFLLAWGFLVLFLVSYLIVQILEYFGVI